MQRRDGCPCALQAVGAAENYRLGRELREDPVELLNGDGTQVRLLRAVRPSWVCSSSYVCDKGPGMRGMQTLFLADTIPCRSPPLPTPSPPCREAYQPANFLMKLGL